jgi:hypothetical protein
MSETSGHTLSVAGLFAERDAHRRHDQEALEELQRRKEEELAEFRKRLDNLQLTDAIIQSGLDRIKRAFERGETELMFSSFPSHFCTDGGRAIINAGAPPLEEPPETRWFRFLRPHHRLSRWDAGRRRPVLHLAEQYPGGMKLHYAAEGTLKHGCRRSL